MGAFTCYDVTTALGVVRAAEARDDPVILLVGEASFRSPARPPARCRLSLAVADEARVPACVQLDHVDDDELIDAALAAGAGAVMADGSRLPLDDNAAFVAAVRARAAGAGVEAELGHIEGGEDVAAAAEAGALTDPDEAAAFVAATGCDCLAVSIGNVHGRYARAPELDWERLARSASASTSRSRSTAPRDSRTPTSRRAIALGICKVNVNTELRERYLAQLEAGLPAARTASASSTSRPGLSTPSQQPSPPSCRYSRTDAPFRTRSRCAAAVPRSKGPGEKSLQARSTRTAPWSECQTRVTSRRRTLTNAAPKQTREPLVLCGLTPHDPTDHPSTGFASLGSPGAVVLGTALSNFKDSTGDSTGSQHG